MKFAPIAIIGEGCVFPGAHSPMELWEGIKAKTDFLSEAAPSDWRMSAGSMERLTDKQRNTTRGGYIRGFGDVFDPHAFLLPAEEIVGLDPFVHWMLYAARQALLSAGFDGTADSVRAGAVVGNLSLPSRMLSRYCDSVWIGEMTEDFESYQASQAVAGNRPDPRNRFMSGYPAQLLSRALGLDAGAYALDAACASSLYAIKLACDRLHDGRADVMLAGAVNGTDPLFLHAGFHSLQAMSPSGQSRPFHKGADGLVPSEGAGFVVLKRLKDALAAGDRILGVIRGVGLSNDGGRRSLIAPAVDGQVAAMRDAYRMSGIRPADVSLIECHATGTLLGDATEIASMSRMFEGLRDVPIGSLKSNMGHLVTAAGIGGLIKVLGAFRDHIRPASLHADAPLENLTDSPFRLLADNEPWQSDVPRIAAVSGFGFGGNNAHLLVEEWAGQNSETISVIKPDAPKGDLAIIGMGVVAGNAGNRHEFAEVLFGVRPSPGPKAASVRLEKEGLVYPPRDLEAALPQQLMVLQAAREAVADARSLPERTGVIIGMQCDTEVARFVSHLRWEDWLRDCESIVPPEILNRWKTAGDQRFDRRAEPAQVIGMLPNIPANRLNHFWRLPSPGYTVSAEELSGLVALDNAARALRSGELDAALVGAVDLSGDSVQTSALSELYGETGRNTGDAAVVLVIKRLEDAEKDGDSIYAVLPDPAVSGKTDSGNASSDKTASNLDVSGDAAIRLGNEADSLDITDRFGKAHCASGLLYVAAGALSCKYRVLPALTGSRPALPWLPSKDPLTAVVTVRALGGAFQSVHLRECESSGHEALIQYPVMRMHVYAGETREQVLDRLSHDQEYNQGSVKLVVLATDHAMKADRLLLAQTFLRKKGPGSAGLVMPGEGVYYCERPIKGEMAFVFTGAAVSYPGMGRELLLAFPQLVDQIKTSFPHIREAVGWVYDPASGEADEPEPLQRLFGTSFLSIAHAGFTREILGLKPQAAIGMSAGETNSLLAMGAWNDRQSLFNDFGKSGLFTRDLGGTFAVLGKAWGTAADKTWENWRILAPVDAVRAALTDEPRVHLTIIHTNEDCVIGGESGGCERVLKRVGAHRGVRLYFDVAIHCPEVGEVGAAWRKLHHRVTLPVPGVRFYTASTYSAYEPDAERCADALLGMALNEVDFPRLIEQAYADGIRIFVEHGPRDLCGQWIRKILGGREHLSVSMDQTGRSSLDQILHIAAQLTAGGVEIRYEEVDRLLQAASKAHIEKSRNVPVYTFPAHRLFDVETQTAEGAASKAEAVLPMAVPQTVPVSPPAAFMPAAPVLPMMPAVQAAAGTTFATSVDAMLVPPASHELPAPLVQGNIRVSSKSALDLLRETAASYHQKLVQAQMAFQRQENMLHLRFLEQREKAILEMTAALQGIPDDSPSPAAQNAGHPLHPVGPAFTREQLETLATGKISDVFGPAFASQDGYVRQVRMPGPPLLLADRVIGVKGEPGKIGQGIMWTQTDVRTDSWYLHDGYMPLGIMIESGQADLFLISWQGIDSFNRGERVYRLLGCDLMFHGPLAKPGETLTVEIRIDGHAKNGDTRLFFFNYDCYAGGTKRITMRNGQAGFFSDEELADSGGVIWDMETADYRKDARLDPPVVASRHRSFSREQVALFAQGHAAECFGEGFEMARTHVRTPRIQSGDMMLMEDVQEFDPQGGPWKRGYIRAHRAVKPDDWFFESHFLNDPVMPGTLMVEGCLQTIAFYMAALGFTLDKDGYRFEPVPEELCKLQCRGQVVPSTREIIYEVFVEEVHGGAEPRLYADVLVTVDGLKACFCRRMGLRLIPDWPLTSRTELLAHYRETKPVASSGGFEYGYASLLACAWGKPSDAFGPAYRMFDGTRRLPRLPGPPYHFMSRVTKLNEESGTLRSGASAEIEYDIPADAWYFAANGSRTMPMCILMEAALQPCGWLSAYVGIPLASEMDLCFRNLDGTGTLYRELRRDDGVLRTRTTLTDISRMGEMVIETFEVECFVEDELVFEMNTVFGHFPEEVMRNQVGLPTSEADKEGLTRSSAFFIDLQAKPALYFGGLLRLPEPQLLMLDRITGYWPDGGQAKRGRMRAEKTVRYDDWFFKAHFFQDPVQPGSLGIEAIIQLLQAFMLEKGMGRSMRHPRFEPIELGRAMTWKYRGQVVPTNGTITTEIEIVELEEKESNVYAVADANLWVDGKKIYSVRQLGIRIVEFGMGRSGEVE